MIEYFFNCPYCFAEISILIDPSVSKQEYIEDCEVCCNPISFDLEIQEEEITQFTAQILE